MCKFTPLFPSRDRSAMALKPSAVVVQASASHPSSGMRARCEMRPVSMSETHACLSPLRLDRGFNLPVA